MLGPYKWWKSLKVLELMSSRIEASSDFQVLDTVDNKSVIDDVYSLNTSGSP